jgi:acyl carrier protein
VTPEGRQMIEYIVKEVIRRPGTQIDEKTPLVSSGLIDSMSLVDILLKLEDFTRTRIPAGKVQAKDMDTVELMFATAHRVGKPRP